MTRPPRWKPAEFVPGIRQPDFNRPSVARVYDMLQGGDYGYETDRIYVQMLLEVCPFAKDLARHNRWFMNRAVQYCAGEGIRQFIDLGCGFPTVGNVHEIVSGAHVLYVDHDVEVTVAMRTLLHRQRRDPFAAAVVDADICEPDTIVDHPDFMNVIDPRQPVALIISSVLPFVANNEDPFGLVRWYLDFVASGSMLVVSHATMGEVPPIVERQIAKAAEAYGDLGTPATLRTEEEFTSFFDGLEFAEPGVVAACDWRPTVIVPAESLARPFNLGAVGRKPGRKKDDA